MPKMILRTSGNVSKKIKDAEPQGSPPELKDNPPEIPENDEFQQLTLRPPTKENPYSGTGAAHASKKYEE